MTPTESALLAFLQSELLVVSNEVRRKQPDLKQSIEACLQDLRSLKDAQSNLTDHLVTCSQCSCVMTICLDAVKGPNRARCLPSAVSIAFRLVNHKALVLASVGDVLTVMETAGKARGVKEGGGEDVQLKCLQLAIPLWQNYLMPLSDGESNTFREQVGRLLSICFKLCFASASSSNSSNDRQSVGNAAMAITRQLLIYLFERVVQEPGNLSKRTTLISVLQDICLWLHMEASLYIQVGQEKPSPAFCVEMLESLFGGQQEALESLQEIVGLLKDQICPFIVRKLDDMTDFALAVRLWRFVGLLLQEYSLSLVPLESEIFLSFMSRVMEDRESEAVLQRLLVLETLEALLSDESVFIRLHQLSESCASDDGHLASGKPDDGSTTDTVDCKSTAFSDAISSLFRFTLNEITDVGMITAGCGSPNTLSYDVSCPRMALLSSFDKSPPSNIPSSYVLFLSVKCISNLADILLLIINEDAKAQQGDKRSMVENTVRSNDRRMAEIIDRTCGLNLDKKWINKTFDVFSNWIKSSKSVDPSLDLSMDSLCCIAKNCSDVQTEICSASVKCCFKTAGTIGNLLNGNNWRSIIEVIVAIEQSKSPGLVEHSHALLESSKSLSEASYLLLQTALISFMKEKTFGTDAVLIAATELKQLALANASRFADRSNKEAWIMLGSVVNFLCSDENAGVPQFRRIGCDIGCKACAYYFEQNKDNHEDSINVLGLEILDNMTTENISSMEVLKCALESLHSTLNLHGHSFKDEGDGWKAVFCIFSRVIDALPRIEGAEGHHLVLLRTMFSTLKIIGSEFISLLSKSSLQEWIVLLGRIFRTDIDLNISLSLIGQLWDTADVVVTKGWKEEWKGVIKELAEGAGDARSEVRNSCVQTVFRTVEVHGRELDEEDWPLVFNKIIKYLCKKVDTVYDSLPQSEAKLENSHFSRDTTRKQWDETLVFILQGLSQVFREHFSKIQFESWAFLVDRFGTTLTESGRSELVAVTMTCIQVLCSNCVNLKSWDEWKLIWRIWKGVCVSGLPKFPECFEQSTLLTYLNVLKMLLTKFDSVVLDNDRDCDDYICIRDVYAGIQRALQHPPTQSDRIHDSDSMNELQKFVMALISSAPFTTDLYKRLPGSKSELLKMLSAILDLARPNQQVILCTSLSSWSLLRKKAEETGQPTDISKDFSRVALFVSIFDFSTENLSWFREDGDRLWNEHALQPFIASLTRWASDLKYQAPRHKTRELREPWIIATNALISLINACNQKMQSSKEYWEMAANSLAKVLVKSAESVPCDIETEKLDADEKVDLETLEFIGSSILDHQGVTEKAVHGLLKAIQKSSLLFNTVANRSDGSVMDAPVMAVDNTERVVKGRLAAASFLMLFDKPSARQVLFERLSSSFSDYITAQQSLGIISAPQSRQEELDFILSQLQGNRQLIIFAYKWLIKLLVTPSVSKAIVKKSSELLLSLDPL